MRTMKPALLLITLSATLAGCGSGGGLLNRDRPDEFAVQRQAPLVVPPDFNLVPPAPGAPRPSEGTAAEQTRSQVETSALDRAGAADPGIRSTVGDPGTNTVAKGRVTRDIIAAPEGDGAAAQAVIPS